MHELMHVEGPKGGAFGPSAWYVVSRAGEALSNVLLRFEHIEDDLALALGTLHRRRVERAGWVGLAPPPNLTGTFSKHGNDVVPGDHRYLDYISDELAALIERWYALDFEAFGFARLSRQLHPPEPRVTSTRAVLPRSPPRSASWVGRACAPVAAVGASQSPSVDEQNWSGPLACRSLSRSEMRMGGGLDGFVRSYGYTAKG